MNIMDSDKSRIMFGRLPFAWQTLLGARTVSAVALDTRSCSRSQRTNLPGRCENYSISSFLRSYAEGSSTIYPQYEWRNIRVIRVLNIACGLAILSTNSIEKTSSKLDWPSDRLSRTYHGLNLRPIFQVTCKPVSIVARVFFGCSCHTTTDPVTANPCTMSTIASMPAETSSCWETGRCIVCGTPSTGRHPTAVEVQIYFIVRDLGRHVRCYVCLAGGSKCHSNPKRECWADAEHSSNLECRYRYGIVFAVTVAYVLSLSLLQVNPTASVEHSALVLKLLSPRMTVMGYSVRVSAVEAMVRGRVTEILKCDAILAVVLDISTLSMALGAYATEGE
ncbi:hypothetical protein BDQ94DRAFT_164222 [Aspergillus welwitschiae]|uniref:Uncharacterized protein n=1 Tax=Aspergillus welwitschiae TaxID=1341132 RepID=A0A3F3PIK1_9EURO|nr:hypothetical protein BDQ94DRAFT_164222 [Aspergillus welwitschiae]RDH26765.1 hypothetical protein BDQ94DRAFT_164222 [Aspergillus welwitschiae]